MMWGFSHDYWMEHGDAWVQIGMPASVASMKKFDAARYGSLTFDNTTKVCPGETEDGLRYDMFSQVAAADVPPTSHPLPLVNVTRPDAVAPTLSRDEVLAAAPDTEDGRFRVPRILDAE
jgi:hypothetical protein